MYVAENSKKDAIEGQYRPKRSPSQEQNKFHTITDFSACQDCFERGGGGAKGIPCHL